MGHAGEASRPRHELPSELLDWISDSVVLIDSDDRFRFVNAAARALLDLTEEQARALIGRTLLEAFPEALASTFRERCERARASGEVVRSQEFHPSLGKWIATRIHPIPGGALMVLSQHVRRTTPAGEPDEQMRIGAEHLRTLVEMSTEVSALFDESLRLLYASPAYERITRYPPTEAATLDHVALVHPGDLAALRAAAARATGEPGTAVEATFRFRCGDGKWRTLTALGRDLRHDPVIRGFLVNARDVTEQRHLEERLLHSQKMEALGQLAGGVAHDFNNILAAITGFAELLRSDIAADDPRQEFASEILRAGARAARVTRQLLAFSRRQALSIEVIDLCEVVKELGRMLRPLLPASIVLDLPQLDGPLYVHADKVQLEQVLMNLAVNARDAMPDGGTLTIDVRRTDGRDGAKAILVVRDTGTGMTEHTLEHLFEPFFTTKPAGRGTGLGLPTVYGIVRQLGGSIEVQSAPGAGSAFTITLEATESAPRPAEHPRDVPVHHSARRLVLVVEDEEPVRRLVVRILERANYETRVARNGVEAMELLDDGMNPALVLSDSAMPVMGGRELAARIAERRPELPVVLMSGLLESGEGTDGDERAEWVQHTAGFVEKPFSTEQLLTVIRRALGE